MSHITLGGWRIKKGEIRKLIKNEKVEFICIQETKMESIDFGFCQSLWGGTEIDWRFKKSEGSSGGLLSLWSNKCFTCQDSVEGTGYLGIKGIWGNSHDPCFIFNIYSPCQAAGRRALWEELLVLRANNLSTAWCLAGDFDAVRCVSERSGLKTQL